VEEKLARLKELTAPAIDLQWVSSRLSWDQETYMPPGAAQSRADQLATINELAHRTATNEEIGQLLDDLAAVEDELDYDSDEAALIRVTRREYEKRVNVPPDLIARLSRAAVMGVQAWMQARADQDFNLFLGPLETLIDLKREWAEIFQPYDNLYDPLLDDFEPGMTYAQIGEVFAGLKPALTELVAEIVEHRDAVDDLVLYGAFDERVQLAIGRAAAEALGYDFDHGRIDLSAHPFTSAASPLDVRITTRVDEAYLPASLMGTIHETGHALYEQHIDPALYRTVLDTGASMAVHESQSRLYENIIGRGRAFWRFFYPEVQAVFPVLADVDREEFYRAINRSQPSLIRTEADEVTYGLHIILRFELENDLINGRVSAVDLPEVWNERMETYLGVVPDNLNTGVLQDIHWSEGLFGYFPDYLLGSVFSVQLWEALQADVPDVESQIEGGEFDALNGWLQEHVHRHGMKFTLPELAERATGHPLTWEPYMRYLRTKFGELYDL
jgi:carboxypeptidase Taq